jgi:hypothetical protein
MRRPPGGHRGPATHAPAHTCLCVMCCLVSWLSQRVSWFVVVGIFFLCLFWFLFVCIVVHTYTCTHAHIYIHTWASSIIWHSTLEEADDSWNAVSRVGASQLLSQSVGRSKFKPTLSLLSRAHKTRALTPPLDQIFRGRLLCHTPPRHTQTDRECLTFLSLLICLSSLPFFSEGLWSPLPPHPLLPLFAPFSLFFGSTSPSLLSHMHLYRHRDRGGIHPIRLAAHEAHQIIAIDTYFHWTWLFPLPLPSPNTNTQTHTEKQEQDEE